MKPGEIRELRDHELTKKATDVREELFNTRILIATNQSTNVAKVNKLRKDLARILSIIKERELQNKEKV